MNPFRHNTRTGERAHDTRAACKRCKHYGVRSRHNTYAYPCKCGMTGAFVAQKDVCADFAQKGGAL